jgi:hypothetical protein
MAWLSAATGSTTTAIHVSMGVGPATSGREVMVKTFMGANKSCHERAMSAAHDEAKGRRRKDVAEFSAAGGSATLRTGPCSFWFFGVLNRSSRAPLQRVRGGVRRYTP